MARQVWAPRAGTVDVEVAGVRHRLAPGPDGWFAGGPPLATGTRYDLVVDDAVVRPDPRARRLPDGVHGAAAAWDPATVGWADAGWAGRELDGRAVLYELHVGTFTAAGTFAGAVAHLDDLAGLGVTHVEVMPVAAFDGSHGWGYDGVAIDAVHEPYGGPDGLCAFVDAAHACGLAVLVDVVHNHLGPSGNSWGAFGPFLTDRHSTLWGDAVNLDGAGSDDVRAILVDSALSWLRDFHLDGLRLDAVHELHDDRAVHYLQDLSVAVAGLAGELGRPLALVAESDRNDARTVVPVRDNGLGMTAQWDDDVHHALHWLLAGESAGYYTDFAGCPAVAHTLTHGFRHDGSWSSFRGRTHGAPVDWSAVDPRRFVVALQTHDQVGNRASGARLGQLVGTDGLAAGAALLLTLPFLPMLFMGEEWGAGTPWQFFTSYVDPGLADAVTTGRRQEFADHGWTGTDVPDPQDPATFERSRLAWGERGEPRHAAVLDWYRTLLALRAAEPGLGAGRSQPGATDSGVACSWQEDGHGRPLWFQVCRPGWATVVSLVDAPTALPTAGADWEVAADWDHRTTRAPSGGWVLGARGAVVLRTPSSG